MSGRYDSRFFVPTPLHLRELYAVGRAILSQIELCRDCPDLFCEEPYKQDVKNLIIAREHIHESIGLFKRGIYDRQEIAQMNKNKEYRQD